MKNDDTVSRQAVLDAIFVKPAWHGSDGSYYHTDDIRDAVNQLPSAEPIIRCKDCAHYYYADNRIPQEQRYTCDLDGDRWRPDSFCSFAERRADERHDIPR